MVKERQLLRGSRKQAPLYPYESIIPDGDNSRSIGSTSKEYHDAYVDGSGYFDAISISKNMMPEADSYTDIGSANYELRNVYIDSTGFVDVIQIHDSLRVPATSAYTKVSGLGCVWLKNASRPYLVAYTASGAGTVHVWASLSMRTGAKSW